MNKSNNIFIKIFKAFGDRVHADAEMIHSISKAKASNGGASKVPSWQPSIAGGIILAGYGI